MALAVVTAACGSASAGGDAGAARAPAPGQELTVEEAVAADTSEPLLVRGMAYDAGDGQPRLCALILESFPPQCGDPALQLRGVDVAELDGAQREGDVVWAEGVSLLGTVRDGVLTVSEASR